MAFKVQVRSGQPSADRYPLGPDGDGDQAARAGGLAKHTRTVFPRHQRSLDCGGFRSVA
jgi:hypothetical protein